MSGDNSKLIEIDVVINKIPKVIIFISFIFRFFAVEKWMAIPPKIPIINEKNISKKAWKVEFKKLVFEPEISDVESAKSNRK